MAHEMIGAILTSDVDRSPIQKLSQSSDLISV